MSLLNFFEQLRSSVDLVSVVSQYIVLQRKGKEFLGVCPFHNEKTPSFTVNPAKQFYHCFGCAAHGDVIKFVAERNNISYKEGAFKLALEKNIPIPKYTKEEIEAESDAEKVYHTNLLANKFFQQSLNQNAIKYLSDRSISAEVIKEFGIGFANREGLKDFLASHQISLSDMHKAGLIAKSENGNNIYEVFRGRIIFPIFNLYNKIIGFGGRVTDNNIHPKYLNSPETLVFKKGENFYGENYAISASYKKGNIIVVEGYLDAISLYKAGFKNTVASLGTAISEKQLLKLWRYIDEIILCLDPDEAGLKATKKVIEIILPIIDGEKKISFLSLPRGLDPDDAVNKKGSHFFDKLIEERKNLSEMIWRIETLGFSLSTPEDRAKLEKKLDSYCVAIQNNTLKKHYQIFFKDQIWRLGRQIKVKNYSNIETLDIDEYLQIEYNLMAVLCKYTNLLYTEKVISDLHALHLDNVKLRKFKQWLMLIAQNNKELNGEISNYFTDSEIIDIYSDIRLKQNLNIVNIQDEAMWNFFLTNHNLIKLQRTYDRIVALKGNGVDLEETRSYYNKINALRNYIEQLKNF